MTPEEYAALLARIDEQDRRIAMLETHGLEHHEGIKQAVDVAAKASRSASAALELLQQVLAKGLSI